MNLKHCRVLVTPTTFGKNNPDLCRTLEAEVGEVRYNPFSRPLSAAEVKEAVQGCQGYIAGLDSIDSEALSGADGLRVIARYGVGVSNVDLRVAEARGIVVTNTPRANTASVAELTIGLMLSAARAIPQLNHRVHNGEWPRHTGFSLSGKTIGLVGLGAIGREVAMRLNAWSVRLLAYDPYAGSEAASLQVQLVSLEKLLAESDVVTLHVPATPETYHMIGARSLAAMKRGAILVNTARGELIDHAELVRALTSGQLSAAALDTFEREPPVKDDPLFKLPQVVTTPHSGAHTDAAVEAMGWGALHDCLAVLKGEEPTNRVPVV